MTTFAHFSPSSPHVLDPRPYDDVDAYKASFGGVAETLWYDHEFKKVPDGTKHGAKDNGDGTYTNPVVVTPSPAFKSLTKAEFQAHYAANGNNLQASLDSWPTA